MSYFLTRDDDSKKSCRAHVSLQPREEKPTGIGKKGTNHNPVDVLRGECRDEVLDRKLQPYYAQGDQHGGYLNKFSPSNDEFDAELHQKKHAQIRANCESNVFASAQADPVPHPRLHQLTDEAVRVVFPPTNVTENRKDQIANVFSSQAPMVDRMMQANHPLPLHPQVAADIKHHPSNVDSKRNQSQIAVGGFTADQPSSVSRFSGGVKRLDVDYSTFIPDRIQPRRYYLVDGKMVDAQAAPAQGVNGLVNFFDGQPLLCSKFITDNSASPSHGVVRKQHPDIPEPPHRKAPFEHGRVPL